MIRVLARNPDFTRLWAGQTVSFIGTGVSQLALPTVAILLLHASAFEVGVLAALQRLPFLLFSLPAGALLDRMRRRPVMIVCDLTRAAVLASVPLAFGFGHLLLAQLYTVAFVVGFCNVFFDVGYLSLVPALLPREELMGGNQLVQGAHAGADLAGPGLAGIAIQLAGSAPAILLDAVSYLFSAAMLLSIRGGDPRPSSAGRRHLAAEIGEGLGFVFGNPLLRSQLIGLTLGGLGLFMVIPLVLLFAYGPLRLTPGEVGFVFVLQGVAGLVGLWVTPHFTRAVGLGRSMWLTQVGFGLGLAAIPLAALGSPLAVLVAALVLVGVAETIQNLNQVNLRLSLTPQRLQGRMNATFRLFFWGSVPLATLFGGALGTAIGVGRAIFVGGVLTVLAAAVIAFSPVGRVAAHPQIP